MEVNTKYRCAIIDDDEIAIFLLKSLIDEVPNLEIVVKNNSAIEGISELRKYDCDILFLDVEMPKMTGLDVLNSNIELPPVVLISSHDSYAADGFKFEVIDFISKPVTMDSLSRSIRKLERYFFVKGLLEKNQQTILFRSNNSWVVKKTSDIIYIQSYSDYIKIYCQNECYLVNKTMKKMNQELSEMGFLRVHRQYIINLDKIRSISSNEILLSNDLTIKLGPKYAKSLKSIYQ